MMYVYIVVDQETCTLRDGVLSSKWVRYRRPPPRRFKTARAPHSAAFCGCVCVCLIVLWFMRGVAVSALCALCTHAFCCVLCGWLAFCACGNMLAIYESVYLYIIQGAHQRAPDVF